MANGCRTSDHSTPRKLLRFDWDVMPAMRLSLELHAMLERHVPHPGGAATSPGALPGTGFLSGFQHLLQARAEQVAAPLGAAKPMIFQAVLTMDHTDPDVRQPGRRQDRGLLPGRAGWTSPPAPSAERCQVSGPPGTNASAEPEVLIMGLRDHGYAKARTLLAGGRTDPAADRSASVGRTARSITAKLEKIPAEARPKARRPSSVPRGEDGGPRWRHRHRSCGSLHHLWGVPSSSAPWNIDNVDHRGTCEPLPGAHRIRVPRILTAGLFKNLENRATPGARAPPAHRWIDEMDIDIPVYGMDVDILRRASSTCSGVGLHAGAFEDRARRPPRPVAELLRRGLP
ncbi:hypothetical protein FQA39_LY18716 [Lamprigera yunnana]|nr:hypothetical protein FQA39_LY18716 [Lamprigera yunnana]